MIKNESQLRAGAKNFHAKRRVPFTDSEILGVRAALGIEGHLRNVPGAPGYLISDCGRVFYRQPAMRRKPAPDGGVREKRPTLNSVGYLAVGLAADKGPLNVAIHRLVALAFLPPPAPGQTHARHLDGNPMNNHLSNIAWGTPKENNGEDRDRHGRTARGERTGGAKLTEDKVREIRTRLAAGGAVRTLARVFGVSAWTIQRIKDGETWKHVE